MVFDRPPLPFPRPDQVDVPSAAHPTRVTLTAVLPPSYPATDPPQLTVHAPHLAPADAAGVAASLASLFSPGAVCLYDAVQALRARDELFAAAAGGGAT